MIKLTCNTLENTCIQYGIPFYKESDINGDKFISQWRKKGIDVIVSIAAPVRFKKKLLELPIWGSINIHHAKLPQYRGMMPNFWQLYNGEKNTWITVHKINDKLDEGDILLQREVPAEKNESLDRLIRRTKRIGAHYIKEALDMIQNGNIVYLPNKPEEGSYFSFPTRANVCEFCRRGGKLL